MKNKKIFLYLLGFLVICIWGIIIIRIYTAVGDEKEVMVALQEDHKNRKTPIPVLQPDTFQLQLNYPDPFIEIEGAADQEILKSEASLPVNIPAKQLPAPLVIKPLNVKYMGYILNSGNKKKVAIISQNGQEKMMQEGEIANQLQLITIANDSVKVKFQGKTSFIKINK